MIKHKHDFALGLDGKKKTSAKPELATRRMSLATKHIVRPGYIQIELDGLPESKTGDFDHEIIKLLRLMNGYDDQRRSLREREVQVAGSTTSKILGVQCADHTNEMMLVVKSVGADQCMCTRTWSPADIVRPNAINPMISDLIDPGTQPRRPIVGLEVPAPTSATQTET